MPLGKHYGSFAKGFADSLIAMMRLAMTRDLYQARMNFYNARAYSYMHPRNRGGLDPDTQAAIDKENAYLRGGGGGGAYKAGPQAEAHGQEMANYLQQNYGLSKAGAGAVVGNAWQESNFSSNFNPGGDKGTAAGMFQWRDARQTDAVNWMRQNNKDPNDWKSHLDYAMHETQRDYPGLFQELKTTTDPKAATQKFFSTYERGAPDKANMPNREGMATAVAGGAQPTQVAANVPSKTATPEEATTAAPGGDFRLPGAPALDQLGPESARAPSDTSVYTGAGGLQPQDQPSSGVGASATSGMPAPQNEPGEAAVGAIPAQPMMPPRTPTPAPATSGMPAPQNEPGEVAVGGIPDTGARPDLTARSPPTNANVPSAQAQPVSATRAIPATPAQDPRFVQVSRPNADVVGRQNVPQTTALDLSHLWGPNPPLAQRAPQPPGPPPPARPQMDDWSSAVGSPNMDDAALGAQITASAKGGPITRRVSGFATGGAIPGRPTTKFAAGGAPSLAYGTYQDQGGASMGTTDPSVATSLGYQPWNAQQWLLSQPTSPNTNVMALSSQGIGQDINALPANVQTWYNEQVANKGGGNYYYNPNSLPTTPAAATPAPAPAPAPATVINPPSVQNITTYPASTTVTDPTTTTTTGTPGVPNIITAASYDPNVIGTTGTGSAVDSSGNTNYNVNPTDTTQQILSRKGGPIRRFAGGGGIPSRPVLGFAGGYAVPSPNPVVAAMEAGTYTGPGMNGTWTGTPYAQLAPNQQAWANQQQSVWNQIGTGGGQDAAYWGAGGTGAGPTDTSQYLSQLSLMPAAIWPAAAPTAPTPLNEPGPTATNITAPQVDITSIDPTSTTTTGTPGVPTTGIQAATYDPNNIATTGSGSATDSTGGTNYSTDPTDYTTQILSRKGGPITRRVSRYDDGGGVSPSVAGMPPGLGGAAPIPPIYYNPATYAGAGAPVGKGVSQTSAPTYGAGAIPSLPMAQGGVVAFDDGGAAAEPDPMAELNQMDFEDARMDQGEPAAPPTPMSDKDPGWYVGSQDAGATTGGAAGTTMPPPPDPTTAQVTDGQGNPSGGLIGAITSGLHWLGDHLGLVGGAQAHPAIAQDPQTQDSRQKFSTNNPEGDTYITHQNMEELKDYADPGHQLDDAYRNIAGLEAGWKFAMSHGDEATAGRLAASMLHYSVLASQNLSDKAATALRSGNLQDTVRYINDASDALPDGRLVHATLSPDGKTVQIQGKDLNGNVEWQQTGAAQAILEHATSMGRSGKLQWDALESQAAKYDSTFANMVKNRQANASQAVQERRQDERWQHQQDVIDARQKAKEDAAAASAARVESAFAPPAQAAPPTTPAITPRVTPALPGPGTTTAATAGAPPSPDSTGAAATAAAPPTSDENQGQGPTVANASAIPPTAATANLPTTDAQEVAAYQRRYNLVAQQVIQQVGPEPQPPSQPDWSQLQPGDRAMASARLNAAQKDYQDRHAAWSAAVREGIAGEMKDIGAERSDTAAMEKERFSQSQQAQRAQDIENRTEQFERERWQHAEAEPMDRKELDATFKDKSAASFLAGSTFTATNKGDGPVDDTASAQKLGQMFDLGDRGGIRRVQALSNALYNTQAINKRVGTEQLGDTIVGMANGQYGYRSKVSDDGMRTVEIYPGKVGDGTPMTIKMSPADFARVDQIKGEFASAQPKSATQGAIPNLPSLSQRFRPSTPIVPMVPRQNIPGRPSQLVPQ